jgi:hypothetical protein
MGKQTEMERALEYLALEGWYVHDTSAKGYVEVRCSCGGKHIGWLHKTPSNPQHYRQKANRLIRMCHIHQESVP